MFEVKVRGTSGTSSKESAASAGDTRDLGSIPGSGRSPGVGNGSQLQYSCLENFRDRGAWPWGGKELDMTEHMHARIRTTNCGPHIRLARAQQLLTTVLKS